MFLAYRFVYLLIFQFILLSDAAFVNVNYNSETYNSRRSNVSSVKTTSAHDVTTDTPQDDHTRLIESLESIDDEITVCIICRAVGCIELKSHPNPLRNYHDHDSDQNSVSTLLYNNGHSQNENISDHEQSDQNQYELSGFDASGITFMQTDAELIQDDEQLEQSREQQQTDEPHSHATVNIINDRHMSSDVSNANDDDCLIGCGNNQTLVKCQALYHKKCLTKWITTSKKDVCLICNRKLSQTLLPQCTKQTQNIQRYQTARATGHSQHPCIGKCIVYTRRVLLFVLFVGLLSLVGLLIYAVFFESA